MEEKIGRKMEEKIVIEKKKKSCKLLNMFNRQ